MAAIVADIYQPMTAGNDTDLLTRTIMENGDIAIPNTLLFWFIPSGGVFVSTNVDMTLPEAVEVDSTEYNFSNTNGWRFEDRYQGKLVRLEIENPSAAYINYDQMTVGCYMQFGQTGTFSNFHDNILISGSGGTTWAVLQSNAPAGTLQLNGHSSGPDSATIDIVNDKLYWVNLMFDGINGLCRVAVYDPDTGAEVGQEDTSLPVGQKTLHVSFGRTDGHGDNASMTTSSYFGQVMIDVTGTFPLLPDFGSAPVPAPGWKGGGWKNTGWKSTDWKNTGWKS